MEKINRREERVDNNLQKYQRREKDSRIKAIELRKSTKQIKER